MNKYTFIVDFDGGKYISQHKALTVVDALRIWAHSLDTAIYKQRIIDDVKEDVQKGDEEPTPLKEIENVWCCTFISRKHFLLVNIIETV